MKASYSYPLATPIARWAGLPFLFALAIQGMPLGRELAPVLPLWAQDIHATTAASVNTVGGESILPALYWGLLYLIAIISLARVDIVNAILGILQRQFPITILLMLVIASTVWSPNTGKILANFAHGIGVTAIALAAAMRYSTTPKVAFHHISLVLSGNLLVHLGGVFLKPDLTVAMDGRWAGLAGHSNVFGSIAYGALWANAVALLILPKAQRRVHWLGLFIAVFALYESGSATASIAAMLGCSVLLGMQVIKISSRVIGIIILSGIFMLAGLLLVAAFSGAGDLLEAASSFAGRSDDFSGRTEIWLAAFDLIANQPLLGWGFDDNAQVINVTGMPHTHYHNGYLDLTVRGGIVAVILLILSIVTTFQQSSRGYLGLWESIAMSLIASVLVYNMTEVTFFAPRNFLWILFLFIAFVLAKPVGIKQGDLNG